MFEVKYHKRIRILAILAIPALLFEWWAAFYFYRFYTLGHAPFTLIMKAIILPTLFWSCLLILAFVAWRRKWYWYVFVPLITTYPWIYNNVIVITSGRLNIHGQWLWTVMFYSWTKVIFYMASLIASIYFVINKFQQRNKSS